MGTHPIFESDFDCLTEKMKLFRNVTSGIYFSALIGSVLSKTPKKASDLDLMSEDEREDLDQKIFEFDSEQDEWDPYDLDEEDIKQRLTKIVRRIDHDSDEKLSRKELINHIHKALFAMDADEAEDEFVDADQDGDDRINWNEFVEEFYGLDVGDQNNILKMDTDTGTEFNRMYARDKGRFHAADRDTDGALTLIEYISFKNPLKTNDLRDQAIAWALKEVDADKDGKVSLKEYMSDYMTKPTDGLEYYGEEHLEQEKRKFEEELDVDGNGVLEGEELSFWMGPDNTEIAIEEAEHLIEMCDENGDGFLSKNEIMDNHELWLDSDATEYGQQLRYAHEEL